MKEKWLFHLKEELKKRRQQAHKTSWQMQARPEQLCPPGDWKIWLILAGRGFGKTRTGAETIRNWVITGCYKRICLLSHSFEEGRSIMIEGESGLLSISPKEEGVQHFSSKRQLIWPNAAVATVYSAQSPEHLRGPQFDAAWIDEFAKFHDPEAVFDQLMFCLRLGTCPRIIITTTPRPVPFLKQLMQRQDCFVTRGSTYQNKENLSASYLEQLSTRYAGTRLGAQEIEGHLFEDTAGALWKPSFLLHEASPPQLSRIIVAIDPAVTHGEKSDETGIVVVGKDEKGRGYVLEDLSGRYSPIEWIDLAVRAFHRHCADRIVAEVNNGGDMVENLLHTLHPHIPYKAVRATRGKYRRAEPIAALYEQGKIFHTKTFLELEEQLLNYTPQSTSSPDRLDALVWGLTFLFAFEEKRLKVWAA
jgi:phage terminase large subunit-like protein